MCHAKYSTWLYIYIFLININVNKRETLIKQIGYSKVSYKIYRKKYLPVGKTSQTLDEKLLSFSQQTSVLSLLFKKGDPLVLDNYRPISLLNVDLKLLSYVLAQRLKKVLEKIVNNDQTGYIKNRFIGFNHRQIQDIMILLNLIMLKGQ